MANSAWCSGFRPRKPMRLRPRWSASIRARTGVPSKLGDAAGSRVVKITIPGLGGAFEGKMSADGKTIVGTWTQGQMPLALTL